MDDFCLQCFPRRDDKNGFYRPGGEASECIAQSRVRFAKVCLPKPGLALCEGYEADATFCGVAQGKCRAARIEAAGPGGLERVPEHLERGLGTVLLERTSDQCRR